MKFIDDTILPKIQSDFFSVRVGRQSCKNDWILNSSGTCFFLDKTCHLFTAFSSRFFICLSLKSKVVHVISKLFFNVRYLENKIQLLAVVSMAEMKIDLDTNIFPLTTLFPRFLILEKGSEMTCTTFDPSDIWKAAEKNRFRA